MECTHDLTLPFTYKIRMLRVTRQCRYTIRLSGKRLHHTTANVIRKASTKFYKNRLRFVKGMTKHFGVFFGLKFQLPFTCTMRILCFTKQCGDTIRVRWEMFTSHHGKFNEENMHQTLSESDLFCKRYDRNILVSFSVHSLNCCSLAKCEC